MSLAPYRISPSFRAALAGKGTLLLALGALYGALAWVLLAGGHGWAFAWRAPLATAFALVGAFLAAGSIRAWADACLAQGCQAEGAVALASRRAGYSLKLPSGRFVEFILFNPWGPLTAGARYTVVYGKYSRILVTPPQPES
jgi:hypothetical protein